MAEIKPYTKCNYEDVGLLCKNLEKTSRVAYILTIGVVGKWRRHGIATILLNKLKENLTDDFNNGNLTRAIYLHVLTTNIAAIRFYEKLHFTRHKFLPLYYLINSASCDGYCYVLYINGGQPPPTILGRLLELCCLCFSLRPFRWLLNISRLTKMCFSNLSSKFVGSPTVKYKGGTYTCWLSIWMIIFDWIILKWTQYNHFIGYSQSQSLLSDDLISSVFLTFFLGCAYVCPLRCLALP